MGPILILAVTFGLMYVLFILPQKKRMAAHRDLLKKVDVGDEVMLTSGFYGTVLELDEAEDVVWLELADGVEVKVARGAVAKRTTAAADRHDDEDDDEPDVVAEGLVPPPPVAGDEADPDSPEPR